VFAQQSLQPKLSRRHYGSVSYAQIVRSQQLDPADVLHAVNSRLLVRRPGA